MSNDPKRHGHAYLAVPSMTTLIKSLTPAEALAIVEGNGEPRPAPSTKPEVRDQSRAPSKGQITWLPCSPDE